MSSFWIGHQFVSVVSNPLLNVCDIPDANIELRWRVLPAVLSFGKQNPMHGAIGTNENLCPTTYQSLRHLLTVP